MPVTLATADHPPRRWRQTKIESANSLLQKSCREDYRRCNNIIRSSFADELFHETHVSACTNGFVYAAYCAYCDHHHLTIRPEDVWFSILSQLNFFVNAHAEELRSFFVSHEGRKELVVEAAGNIRTANFGALAYAMTGQIAKNVLDPELQTWIIPSFSTTTDSDRVVASILMMGALQKYFSYKMVLSCGIPSVTLLGERGDWAHMLSKLEKLPQLGEEPALFYNLLKPVLRKFVASFDNPTAPEVLDFWGKIAHRISGGSGPRYLSGWLTAFCFWDEDGKCLYRDGPTNPGMLSYYEQRYGASTAGCELDGILFHRINTNDIPSGFASVPVTVDDNGTIHETIMVAGSVGIQATSSGKMLDTGYLHQRLRRGGGGQLQQIEHVSSPLEPPGLDWLQPLSGWWMFERDKAAETGDMQNPVVPVDTKSVGQTQRSSFLGKRKNPFQRTPVKRGNCESVA